MDEKLEKAMDLIKEAKNLLEIILRQHFEIKRSIEDRLNEATELMREA